MKAICEVKFKLMSRDYGEDGRGRACVRCLGTYDRKEDIPKVKSDSWTSYYVELETTILKEV